MTDSDLDATVERARRAAPAFGLARQQRVIWSVRRGLQGKRGTKRLVVAVAAAACFAGLVLAVFSWARTGHDSAPAEEAWQLRDGSRILLESPHTRLVKQRDLDTEVLFELAGGAARFDVARRPERAFRVQAGPALIEVIGTRFRIERMGETTLVSVERGRVSVAWAGKKEELSAGEQGLFPPPSERSAPPVPAVKGPVMAPQPEGAAPAASLAPEAAVSASPPHAEELFKQADRARQEGRTAEAARALRQLTQRFPRDARAPLAAFTLGRLLLESRQPADAAHAFALARTLAGGGSALSEDALAREVEAWHAAGDTSKATARAQRYRALYPKGTHIKQVLRLGNVSSTP